MDEKYWFDAKIYGNNRNYSYYYVPLHRELLKKHVEYLHKNKRI